MSPLSLELATKRPLMLKDLTKMQLLSYDNDLHLKYDNGGHADKSREVVEVHPWLPHYCHTFSCGNSHQYQLPTSILHV